MLSQYQCSRLPGKTRLQNDLLCVEWDAKPYTLRLHYSMRRAETVTEVFTELQLDLHVHKCEL